MLVPILMDTISSADYFVTLVDSPSTGTITVTGMYVMVGINHVHTIGLGLGIGYKFHIDYQCIETAH